MYHYVRNVRQTPFPGVKARSIDEFRGQIDYCRRHYRIISPGELMQAIREPAFELPTNALLLTFDDGYIDHYQTVWPILADLGLSGVFAPVAKAVLDGRVLDVNKIHFVLAAMDGRISQVVESLFDLLDEYREAYNLAGNDEYWARLAQANRFDPPEVIFLKRMLQRDLPTDLRERITHILFRKYVTADEASFAAGLYMNLSQLRQMARSGMAIACHGYDHLWLGTLTADQQLVQVRKSLDFLSQICPTGTGWMFTYPYGSTNAELLTISRGHGCVAGFTTDVAIATQEHDPLLLPRLDTNDLPTASDAPIVDWTARIIRNVR